MYSQSQGSWEHMEGWIVHHHLPLLEVFALDWLCMCWVHSMQLRSSVAAIYQWIACVSLAYHIGASSNAVPLEIVWVCYLPSVIPDRPSEIISMLIEVTSYSPLPILRNQLNSQQIQIASSLRNPLCPILIPTVFNVENSCVLECSACHHPSDNFFTDNLKHWIHRRGLCHWLFTMTRFLYFYSILLHLHSWTNVHGVDCQVQIGEDTCSSSGLVH